MVGVSASAIVWSVGIGATVEQESAARAAPLLAYKRSLNFCRSKLSAANNFRRGTAA